MKPEDGSGMFMLLVPTAPKEHPGERGTVRTEILEPRLVIGSTLYYHKRIEYLPERSLVPPDPVCGFCDGAGVLCLQRGATMWATQNVCPVCHGTGKPEEG